MSQIHNLSFGFGDKLPLLLQTEAAECGLACLGMIAAYYGHGIDLAVLRSHYSISLKGSTLNNLIDVASRLNLGTRPVKLEMDAMSQLRLPCILHWNFNHFVVLKEVGSKSITIHDPASGIRKLPLQEVSKSFTGVALELWPNSDFQTSPPPPQIKLRGLTGRVSGLKKSLTQILIIALALEVFALVSPFFLQWVIDYVIVSGDRDLLTTLALGFGLVMILQQITGAIRAWTIMYMGTSLNIQWRANVFTHLIKLPVQYFEKRHLGDILSRFSSIDVIQRTLTTSFVETILDGLMTIITLIMMFLYSPTLGWIAIGIMALYGLTRWVLYRPLRDATEEQIVHTAKQQSHFLETVRGVKPIKLFGRREVRRTTWLSLLVNQINADLRTQKLQLAYKSLNGVLFGIENILIIWFGAKMVLDGKFTAGMLIAFNAYKGQFDVRVSSLIDKLFELKMLRLQGDRLADIILSAPEALDSPHSNDAGNTDIVPSIEAVGVCFRYAESEPYVLKDVNLKIEAGESVAIVGPSGCGKTTLLNIILGILQPSDGHILIGGTRMQNMGHERLRRMVGTVLQDDTLFAGSIAENISFFDNEHDQQWIEECARMAAVSDEIESMPMGYNTLVGDMGTVLSGGQKQRILLARALYKRPKILLLDEATSHLDIAKEGEVNAAINGIKVTRVIIAHRPETIASADRVISLLDGEVLRENHALPASPPSSRTELKSVPANKPAEEKAISKNIEEPPPYVEFDPEGDLSCIGEMVGDARVVVLGQQSPGEGNVLALKSKIVRYLQEEKGFRILAVELPTFDVECANEKADQGLSYAEAAYDILYYMFGRAKQLNPLFSYLDKKRESSPGLRLVGFDTEHTGQNALSNLCDRLQHLLNTRSLQLFDEESWNDFKNISNAIIEKSPSIPESDKLDRYWKMIGAIKLAFANENGTHESMLDSPQYWIQVLGLLEIQGRSAWSMTDEDPGKLRIEALAQFLLWLVNSRYPDDKIIVWVHSNAHALRHPSIPMLGTLLSRDLNSKLICVGLTGSDGSYLDPQDGKVKEVPPSPPNSLESKLKNGGFKNCMLNFRDKKVSRSLENIGGWRFVNYQSVGFPVTESFDLMLYAKDVTPTILEEYANRLQSA